MRLPVTLLLLLINCYIKLHGQSKAEFGLSYKSNTYDTYVVFIDSSSVARFDIVSNTAQLPHKDMMAGLIGNGTNSLMAINASVSGQACETEGLLIIDSVEVKPLNLNNGSTNFYLKPNGVLLFTPTGATIVESGKAHAYKNVVNAVQSGPMLVCNKKINSNFSANSANKNIRCGVGAYTTATGTYLVFAIANKPVNFYDFANLFIEQFKCNDALCLESAGCAMYVTDLQRANTTDSTTICNYLIYHED